MSRKQLSYIDLLEIERRHTACLVAWPEVTMIKSAAVLLLLAALALAARLDRDGVVARSGVIARGLGLELRVEVKLQRTSVRADSTLPVVIHCDTLPATAKVVPCE
jgi:hypothetical protein